MKISELKPDDGPRDASRIKTFPVRKQVTLLIAVLLSGLRAFGFGQWSRGDYAGFLGTWMGTLLLFLLIPGAKAYFARGRKGDSDGFNRWLFWGFLIVLVLVGASKPR